ncbi:gametocyte-specific factor 1 homolog [Drosophila miranda]|uniref:gametocyte-specific factor 1 homolog n=1 Tax=Drosophila miranda TaxID=7229 RepID=UPI0007E746D0|nr:gametocyte-specific factor 1 homolog [Drosophila miranda]
MSKNSLKVAPSGKDEYLICPFDESHRILSSRMMVHLVRCAPNHQGSKKVRCPFNITHICTITEMKIHLQNCTHRAGLLEFKNKLAAPVLPHETMEEIECDENWDEEPDVGTYSPKTYCEQNFVIRNPQGNPPAARREFRESERRRFQQNQNF